jgi:hypothetical protein
MNEATTMKPKLILLTALVFALSVPALAGSLELAIDPATGGTGKFAEEGNSGDTQYRFS